MKIFKFFGCVNDVTIFSKFADLVIFFVFDLLIKCYSFILCASFLPYLIQVQCTCN